MAYINKVAKSDGTVLIDLTSDTATAAKVLSGYTLHDKTGAKVTGSCTYDVDSGDCTAGTSEILTGKTAAVNGQILTGDMPNNGQKTLILTETGTTVKIPLGYHDGTGYAMISADEEKKIVPANIKSGVVILGVTGTYGGETVSAQAKSATPSWSSQTITPDTGYDYLSQVTVSAIPYAEATNSAGGITVTIG